MLFLSVLLFGCPLPPSETTNDNPKANMQGNTPQQNGGTPGANPGAGGKPPGTANVGGEMQGAPVGTRRSSRETRWGTDGYGANESATVTGTNRYARACHHLWYD